MFDIGWSELVVIGIVALIAIGPKELPGVLRTAGHWIGKMRRMAADFQSQFQEAMREAEMADLKKQVEDINQQAAGLASGFDPVATANAEIQQAIDNAGRDTPPPDYGTLPREVASSAEAEQRSAAGEPPSAAPSSDGRAEPAAEPGARAG